MKRQRKKTKCSTFLDPDIVSSVGIKVLISLVEGDMSPRQAHGALTILRNIALGHQNPDENYTDIIKP